MVAILALGSGFLLYAAFAPLDLWWCAPIALALLIHVLQDPQLKKRIVYVVIFGIAFFGPLLSWSNTYVGNIPWLILTTLQIAFLLPLALIAFDKNSLWKLLLFPSLWLLTESLRSRFPFGGFGWGRVAFSQADAPYASLARLGGAPLLSFVVALIAVGLYLLFSRKWWVTIGIVALVSVLTISMSLIQGKPAPRDYSIVGIQGGVPSLGLDFNSRALAVFENHLQATENYLRTRAGVPDVVLWPENAVDVDPFRNKEVSGELQALTDKYGVRIIVGAVLQSGKDFQNASILWEPIVGPTSTYIKQHLTPFGEYIPLRAIAEVISPYAKDVTDFLPGEKIVVHSVGRAEFAPMICFELLDDSLGRSMANKSNVFVVQTNSATFGLSPESEQQLGITRIRSIEHQRYSISISTSGISALVDPQGRVTHQTLKNRAAVIDAVVGLENSQSISDRFGLQIEVLLLLSPLIILFWLGLLRARRSTIY